MRTLRVLGAARCTPAVHGSMPLAAPPGSPGRGAASCSQPPGAAGGFTPGPAAPPAESWETVPSRIGSCPSAGGHTKRRDAQGDVQPTASPAAPHAPAARADSAGPRRKPRPSLKRHTPRPLPSKPPKRVLRFNTKSGSADMTFYGSALSSVEKTAGRRGSGRRSHRDTRPGLLVASPGPSRCLKLPAARPARTPSAGPRPPLPARRPRPGPARRPTRPRR